MRALRRALTVIVGLVVILVGGIYALSEFGREVVTLRTTNTAGEEHSTRLWIVEESGFAWLRVGQPGARWHRDLLARPVVEVVRGGETQTYRAVPVETPEARQSINQRVAEKYGLAETVISWMHDESAVVPIRLEPPVVAAGPTLE